MQRNELLTPLPEADWAEVIRPLTDQLSPVLNIHRLIAHNPDLMAAYTPLRLSFTTAQQLQHRLGDRALLDAIFTIGVYLTLGTILRTFDVPFDGAVETS